ncbi:MAG: hypothetical protein MJ016_00030 [Victivallaceae bacterium]|nr:hypothetical protein [Victivallaceae bacterium]
MKRSIVILSLFVMVLCRAQERLMIRGGAGETGCFAAPDGEMARMTPHVKLAFSGEEVKIEAEIPHPEKEYLLAGKADDDAAIFGGEVLEIMLAPAPETGKYYHIGVNPDGYAYTACKRDKTWGKNVRIRAEKSAGSWRAEVVIPFREMEVARPQSGGVWRGNFGVALKAGKALFPVNWQGATSFHDISEFGEIVFGGDDFPVMDSWRCANDTVEAAIWTPEKFTRSFCRIGESVFEGKKEGGIFRFDFPLPEYVGTLKNRLDCRFFAVDDSGAEVLVRQGLAPFEKHDRFELDSFYCRAGDGFLSYTHQAEGKAVLVVWWRGEKEVFSCVGAPKSGKIPLAGLAPGRYTVDLTAGKRRTTALFFVVPEDFAPPEIGENAVLTAQDGMLRLDGKPLFLFGGSEAPKFPLPFDAAFNLGNGKDAFQRNAIRFTPQPGIKRSAVYPDAGRIVGDLVPQIAEAYAKNPDHKRKFARLAYEGQLPLRVRTAEGKTGMLDPAAVFCDLYETLKTRFPERYYSIHVDHLDLVPRYRKACDILELTSWRSTFSAYPARFLASDMRRAKELAGKKPVLFWFGASLPSVELRPAEILRFAVYTAMLERVNGIVFHLGHGGVPREKGRIWSLLSGINAETQAIYPALAGGRDIPDFVRTPAPDFRLAAREFGGAIYFVAVNLSEEEKVLAVETRSGAVRERFAPLEVKVRVFTP